MAAQAVDAASGAPPAPSEPMEQDAAIGGTEV